ncbi:hypothetical protein MNBD_BACTEROID04-1998 [hydrothermal vent metagenome]|uniref:Uncharacterized protein n=1 Tax=hydrothermal vent metagenome TaxID=652676 RepID=A0A3B0U2L2_9ZZZZ
MKIIDYKKILNKSDSENVITRIVLQDESKKEYELIGILMKEEKDMIRVAFNAKDDEVIDYLDIKKSNVVSINILTPSDIVEL